MGEPISLASGLLTLATFALQSSVTLYDTIERFKSHPKRVCDLKEELKALSEVLGSLIKLVNADTDSDLAALELPLLRCGNACKEFERELLKWSLRSSDGRTSLRDWARLRYMGDDIDGFRRLMAGYNLTFNVALADANLRKSSATAESLASYQTLIETAQAELKVHLEVIDSKFETVLRRNIPESDADNAELRAMQDERLNTEKCLQICTQSSEYLSQIQAIPENSHGFPGSDGPSSFSESLTNKSLQACKRNLGLTTAKLENHMEDLMNQLLAKSKREITSDDDWDLARLRDEWDTARQCIDICSKADNRLKENISTIENYATGDAAQLMVSTAGDIVRGRQVGGHLSDASVEQLSRDIAAINLRRTSYGPDSETGSQPASEFKDRYGWGFKLTPETSSSTFDRL
ncbi:hypothetical protein P168DRAFT_296792 [Aspergillus campestris IBT 28561]|uniref:Azaphilone pigments biosynthesis cluster protein L N-terminal domain-containing protein n=1 Tax=Aspergillus campestris (strain IBT 28561) TaxID=1392248 RepID=A0A2I1D5I6_ASPC2|nr:uncharacterized protein P168DRAFT_296792 [Aspergillus campestris IBT 28561]PKY05130.1 hypothetical protein P168DRAFT_296792 [Aspergillus campestris IBT 28561]